MTPGRGRVRIAQISGVAAQRVTSAQKEFATMPTGSAKVPISCSVSDQGEVIYNSQTCTKYQLQLSSSNGQAHSGVSLAPTTGSYINQTSVNVPSSGSVDVYVYVPTSNSSSVSVTASASGYENNVLPVVS
ncbi:MAG TPA: hypothetical protein VGS41_15800 [Chthonomonadales bacterium]|nr:hypothetical protein [Chthonomonadales bacterium]